MFSRAFTCVEMTHFRRPWLVGIIFGKPKEGLIMGNLKDDLKHSGYSQEEAYFHKLNRELIEKQKRKANLRLIQGGKSERPAGNEPTEEDYGESSELSSTETKKAA